ncbi:suppressor of fused domain protein [Saxibacter everestensis]|uniref:Suppressor of fused domain protein n=1 Tax=Saxibacter everestensis TaxID=2909229 RepID=A0ABY8QU24_9MICO|nr:suppressor of fused domain protein [Brevibacteriaceae bacterium ZFBP1038]
MTTPSPDEQSQAIGGDPVFEHHGVDPLADVAPRDEVRRRACEAHLTAFLGDDFTVLTEKLSTGIHLDIYVFRPTEKIPYVTLVTAGMSDRPMSLPPGSEGGAHLELLLGVPVGWPGIDPLDGDLLDDPSNFWPIKLLKDLARIPSAYDSFLGWGHTVVDDEGTLFAPGVRFAGAIVGPPVGYPPSIMRAITPHGEVDYLAVLPTTPEEMDFKVATPDGGDALIDRLLQARVTAALDPGRASVVSGPPPWSVHVLMKSRHAHLGDVLAPLMPNRAALLAEKQSTDAVIPAGEKENVRWRVAGPIKPAQLSKDAGNSPLRDQVRAAVLEHRGVVTLAPEHPGDGGQVTAVMAMVAMLAEQSEVAAIWLPHQQHVTTAEQFTADIKNEVRLTYRVHPATAPEGTTAVITRGLAAIGGREVLLTDSGMTHDELAKRVRTGLNRMPGEPDVVPAAGQPAKYGLTKYELRESVDPVTQEPVLEMAEAKQKRGLFRRKG